MQKRLAEVLEYMERSREKLQAAVDGVSPALASIKPHDGGWSVTQIIAHLSLVEQSVARLVGRSVAWAREHEIGPETSEESVVSSLELHEIAESTERFEPPEFAIPPDEPELDDSIRALDDSRFALRDALIGGDGLDLSAVKRPHRRYGELNMYQWGLFIAQHEARHTRQIRETLRKVTAQAARTIPIV